MWLDEMAVKRKFDSLAQEAYLSVWRTYDRLKAIEERFFAPFGLTPQQYNVLRLLQGSESAVPTLAIATRLVSRAPDITRMLDRLEQDGYVLRTRSQEDRRAVLVSLTPEGHKILGEIEAPLEAMHADQIGHLSQKELRQLCELLSKARKPHEPDGSNW